MPIKPKPLLSDCCTAPIQRGPDVKNPEEGQTCSKCQKVCGLAGPEAVNKYIKDEEDKMLSGTDMQTK